MAALDGLGEGRGRALFLIGEPGVGKSRIVAEAVAEADRRGVTVLAGRASPTGASVPYQPLSAAVLRVLRAHPLAVPPAAEALRPGLAALLPGFVEGPSSTASPVVLGETVLRLARLSGVERGALIVLEDLHWADTDTLAVVEYLSDNAASEPIVVVGSSRPEGKGLEVIDALDRRGSASVETLGSLAPGEVGEMVRACVGGAEMPEAVVTALAERAEGLPFVVEELLAGMVNRGALVTSASGWQLRGDVGAEVPASFSQTVRERLADLGPRAARVIEAAAVFGRDFDWFYLPAVADLGEEETLDALRRAMELQLVEEREDNRFRFRHAMTVDALVGSMLQPVRARVAARAFDEVADGPDGVKAAPADLVANLAVQAGRPADAARYLALVARHALSAGAVTTAVVTARRARDVAPAGTTEESEADAALLSALSAAGDTGAVVEVGTRLLTELEAEAAPAGQQATTRLLLAKAAQAASDLVRARQLCEEAIALGPHDDRLNVELDLALAEIAFSDHQHTAAVAGAEAVLERADAAGITDLACAALDLLGRYQLQVTGQMHRAEDYLLGSLRRAEQADLPLCRLRVLYQLAQVEMARFGGRARIHEARALAEHLGAFGMTADLDHLLAISDLNVNRLDAASARADRAFAEATRYRLGELAAVVAGVRASIEAVRGHRDEAERAVDRAMATAEMAPQMRAAICGSALVLAALADDDLAAAVDRVADTQSLLRSTSATIVVQPLSLSLFHALAAVVRAAAGRTLVEGVDWVRIEDVLLQSSFDVAKAIAAGRSGEAARAEALFASGDERLARAPWIRALYRRYAAEAALADGWGQPAAWLAESEVYFAHCGNEPLGRACRSLLGVAGVRARPGHRRATSSRYGDAHLTTREADVLALISLGLTNKQIAARLYLSTRTVEKHVERILGKTGAANRTALVSLTSGTMGSD
jgi:DNA-binding CsgD family transcriptional regulator